jgi:hypothetical protein
MDYDPVENEFVLTQSESPGDAIKLALWTQNRIRIEVENPWQGDTESGFGADTSIVLSVQEAEVIAKYLLALIEEVKADMVDHTALITALVAKHNLSNMVNPGGREFHHATAGRLQVGDHNVKEDYEKLLAWLKQHGLE